MDNTTWRNDLFKLFHTSFYFRFPLDFDDPFIYCLAQTYLQFTVRNNTYKMPLPFSFFLIGFFIWIAENIATFFGAWKYPNQQDSWSLVHVGKISSWFLLVVINIMIVAQLKEDCYKGSTISKRIRSSKIS